MRLVYLVFAPNTAYCQVVDAPRSDVEVNAAAGTWAWKGGMLRPREERKIGEGRYLGESRSGETIGVYDADKVDHLSAMVHDAVEAQRDHADFD